MVSTLEYKTMTTQKEISTGKTPDIRKQNNNVFIQTFGCQMNKLDTELFTGLLIDNGYKIVNNIHDAGIILYNTCSVRGHAEEKVYSHIGALKSRKREEPDLIIGVLGCMAQKEGGKIFSRSPQVNLVCGTRMFDKLPDILRSIPNNGKHVLAIEENQDFSIARTGNYNVNSFQAFVSIMRGCDNFCSYCIVPYVRGAEISREIDDIVNEIKMLVENGSREVTLLGQNVNSYGKGLKNGTNLAVLLRTISSIDKLERIRFITSHPKDMTKDILEAINELPKVCKYLHLPAQSGSDQILKKMNRKYTSGYYRDLVNQAAELIPDISISSDFIVGFPGENEDDFQKTFKLMEETRFFNCFIFKYSPRTGTTASKFPDDVPEKTKKERNRILLDLQKNISKDKNRKQIGKTSNVLVEKLNTKALTARPDEIRERNLPGNLFGRNEYNHIVIFDGTKDIIGKFVKVKIDDATDLTLFGHLN